MNLLVSAVAFFKKPYFAKFSKPKSKIFTSINPALADIHLGVSVNQARRAIGIKYQGTLSFNPS